MLHEHVQLFEAARVEQHVYALPCSVLATLVLLGNSLLAAAQTCFLAQFDEFLDSLGLFAHFCFV